MNSYFTLYTKYSSETEKASKRDNPQIMIEDTSPVTRRMHTKTGLKTHNTSQIHTSHVITGLPHLIYICDAHQKTIQLKLQDHTYICKM